MDDIVSDYRKLHATMLDDIKHWRSAGCRLSINNEDVTEKWLADQQRRADNLARVIAAHEKHAAAHKPGRR